jgi:hypothetical protein
MTPARFCRQAAIVQLGLGLLAAIACERTAPATRTDSLAQPAESAAVSSPRGTEQPGWETAAGPVLLVQGEERNEAIVLLPTEGDASAEARLHDMGRQATPVTLFGRGGSRLSGTLADTSAQGDSECRVWPLRAVQTDGAPATWAVGFVGNGAIVPVALDSVDVLSTRDSMALVAEASRLASAVTAITAPSFQGLRFTVHDIRRFETAPGVQALVAHLVRKVNQEANPQEEQTLLIAERDSGVTSGPYQLAFAERTHGLEEQSTTPEVIAAVQLGGRTTLVVARDSDAGVAYSMIERTGPRKWRVRWTSALTRCS